MQGTRYIELLRAKVGRALWSIVKAWLKVMELDRFDLKK
jgi:hypothetical protein